MEIKTLMIKIVKFIKKNIDNLTREFIDNITKLEYNTIIKNYRKKSKLQNII